MQSYSNQDLRDLLVQLRHQRANLERQRAVMQSLRANLERQRADMQSLRANGPLKETNLPTREGI